MGKVRQGRLHGSRENEDQISRTERSTERSEQLFNGRREQLYHRLGKHFVEEEVCIIKFGQNWVRLHICLRRLRSEEKYTYTLTLALT